MGKPAARRRQHAVETTITAFKEREFDVSKGNDCLAMALKLCKGLGIKIDGAAKFKGYNSLTEAVRLAKSIWGVTNVIDWADKQFDRIAPAAALPGDLMALPSADDVHGVGGLGIVMGNDLLFLYDETHPLPVAGRITYDAGLEPVAAWRTLK